MLQMMLCVADEHMDIDESVGPIFSELTMEMLHKTMASFQTRLNLITQNNGHE